MKNLFKLFTSLLVLVFVSGTSFAQQVTKPEKVQVVETYSRLSVTFFMGSHDLRVTIPNGLPILKVSNAVKPFKQLNGSILYNSVKTGKSSAIRIYRLDYSTGW
jgi:hypothetical protein